MSDSSDDDLTNYAAVEVPADIEPERYSAEERRSDLLDRVLEAGSPTAINQTRLAALYDVSQPTISRDMDLLAEHVETVIGDRATLRARAAYERAVDDLFDAGDDDWRATKAAVETAREWAEWAGSGGGDAGGYSGLDGVAFGQGPSNDQYRVVYDDGDLPADEVGDDPESDDLPRDDESGDIDYADIGPTGMKGPNGQGSVSLDDVDAEPTVIGDDDLPDDLPDDDDGGQSERGRRPRGRKDR